MVYQNFQNDWNKRDINGKLVATTTRVTWAIYERDDDGWFDRDFRINHFRDIDIIFDLDFSDIDAGDADSRLILQFLFQLCNTVAGAPNNRWLVTCLQNGGNDDQWSVRMAQFTGGPLQYTAQGLNILGLARYYFRIRRIGSAAYCDVYTTNGLRSIGVPGSGDADAINDGGLGDATAYRFGMVTCQNVAGVDPFDDCSGFLENLDLQEGSPRRGLLGVGR